MDGTLDEAQDKRQSAIGGQRAHSPDAQLQISGQTDLRGLVREEFFMGYDFSLACFIPRRIGEREPPVTVEDGESSTILPIVGGNRDEN